MSENKITDFEREDNQEALHGKISAYLFKLEFSPAIGPEVRLLDHLVILFLLQ